MVFSKAEGRANMEYIHISTDIVYIACYHTHCITDVIGRVS